MKSSAGRRSAGLVAASASERLGLAFCLLLSARVCFLFPDFESLIKELFKPQLEELGVTQPGSRFTSDDLFSLLESPSDPRVGACSTRVMSHSY